MIPFGKDKRVAKRQKMLEDQLEQLKRESGKFGKPKKYTKQKIDKSKYKKAGYR